MSNDRGLAGAAGPLNVTDPPLRFHWPLALVFAALCFAINYPGRLNADSLHAVIVATDPARLGNWHSPTLGWLWGLVPLGQPAAALAFQALLLGLSAGFLPKTPATTRGRAALVAEIGLRLVLAVTFGAIGKDVVAFGVLLLGVQLARYQLGGGRNPALWLTLPATILIFVLVRAPNGFVLVAALALLLPFVPESARRRGGLLALALLLAILAVPLNRIVDFALFRARDEHPDKQLVIFDLAGISVATGSNEFAAIPGWPTLRLPPPERCYLPYMWDAFAPWGPCAAYSRAFDTMEGAATRRWATAIATHPVAYTGHRFRYAGELLGTRDRSNWIMADLAINDPSVASARAEFAELTARLHAKQPIARWRPSPTIRPAATAEAAILAFPGVQLLALVGSLAILMFGFLRRQDGVRAGALIAAALALGNFAMLLVFGVAAPLRYLLPSIALFYAAVLALIVPAADSTAAALGSADRVPL